MCHSDLHTVDGSWGVNKYPIAVGHELGGIVTEVRRYFLKKRFDSFYNSVLVIRYFLQKMF
jgi:threonine dehydrogenase-like Zn-dependent dehydrogenase